MWVNGVCTVKDIETGQADKTGCRSFHCPLAHSILRLCKPGVEVGVSTNRIGFAFKGSVPSYEETRTPDIMVGKIQEFDMELAHPSYQAAPRRSFRYTVDIPDRFVR